MRRKIAKRIRRELMRSGVQILMEKPIGEKGWKRKDCGYSVTAVVGDRNVYAVGRDALVAYKLIRWCMDESTGRR